MFAGALASSDGFSTPKGERGECGEDPVLSQDQTQGQDFAQAAVSPPGQASFGQTVGSIALGNGNIWRISALGIRTSPTLQQKHNAAGAGVIHGSCSSLMARVCL